MIVKRGNRWAARLYLGDGKYRWLGTFETRRDARVAEREASSRPRVARNETCEGFAKRWLTDYPRPSAATQRTNQYALRGFQEHFRGIRLADVDRPTARAWALQQPQSNVRVVRTMYGDALRDGLVHANPFSGLRLEQSRGRRDLKVISEHELQRLADVAGEVHGEFGPTFRAMILFAAYVGVRPGEMFAMDRADVDLDAREVYVRRSLDGLGNLKLPKNGQVRTVILPPPAREALMAAPRRIDQARLFTTPRGRGLTKSTLNHYWDPVRAALGRPGMAFYELRHFCATLLLEMGVSHADVAIQLGHTDGGKLVMSTYGHPSEERARQRLQQAFEVRQETKLGASSSRRGTK